MTNAMYLEPSQYQGRVPVAVFRITGDIDASSSEQLQTEASRSFETGTRNLVLDLSQVKYISSAGLRAIHVIFKLFSAETADEPAGVARSGTFKSPHLKLLNPTLAVRKTLNMTGFEMFLEIHSNLDDAIASFSIASIDADKPV